MNKIIVMLLAAVLTLLPACGPSLDDSGDPGIIGAITSVEIAEDDSFRIASILVEGTPEDNAGLISDKALVSITKDTVLANGTDKKLFEVQDIDALTVGVDVEVVFTGPVAESYPVQGEAKVIRIR